MTIVPKQPIEADVQDDIELTPEELAELDESIAEADRGEGVPAEVVLRELRETREEELRRRR